MISVVSAAVMRASDKAIIESGTDGVSLVERAAGAVFDGFDFLSYSVPVIFCGCGNNGADGLALALIMKKSGMNVRVITIGESRSDECRFFRRKCSSAGIVAQSFSSDTDICGCDLIIDCIFGTGFRSTASGDALDAIRMINRAHENGTNVVSVDIPSGISGDNGLGGEFVHADTTFSIGTLKSGYFLGNGKDAVGRLKNLDIGIPIVGEKYRLCDENDFTSVIRKRPNLCNKGNFGYITLLGGCTDYTGAVKLSANAAAAMRAGCGVCRVAIPRSTVSLIAPCLTEATISTLCDNGGEMLFDKSGIDRALSHTSAAGVGMGWGQDGSRGEILSYMITGYDKPLLIDADGLNTLSQIGVGILESRSAPTVLTPHPKEFERLSGITTEEILSDPIGHAKSFAAKLGVILLLKGPTTVITDGSRVLLVDRGCPGMATAGSGDVLSGIITALLGYSDEDPLITTACGAWIAGRAGEIAESRTNPVSMIASDTVSAIQDAVTDIYTNNIARRTKDETVQKSDT